jgi:hypothetical protein
LAGGKLFFQAYPHAVPVLIHAESMPDLSDAKADSEYGLGSGLGASISTRDEGVLESRVKIGGSNLRDLMETKEENKKMDHEDGVLEDDWGSWYADFEDKFLVILHPRGSFPEDQIWGEAFDHGSPPQGLW